MNIRRSLTAASLCCSILAAMGTVAQAQWQPAAGPLATRWAQDVKPDRVHPEYPRPQMVRSKWQSLNGLWDLALVSAEGPKPPAGEFRQKILVPFPIESALSGVMQPSEWAWYRREFDVPAAWAGQHVLLHFGAVDWEGTIWINGHKLGTHRGGYDPFRFDITDALRPGRSQEIIVRVWDPTDGGRQPRGKQVRKPRGIMYTSTTGIWQSVWLEPVPASHIESLRITPDVAGSCVRVEALMPKGGAPESKQPQHVRLTVLDGGQVVGRGEAKAGAEAVARIEKPKLWSPESPFLYDLRVELVEGDRVLDMVTSYCGMRSVALGADAQGRTRILLNGKPTFLVGPLDQGFWPDGLYTAPTDEALRYDIEITKKLGFNMTRKHVKVEPARWYYWCDRLGLWVWQDMPSGDKSIGPGKGEITRSPESARQFELELGRMIDALRNHPSIMMWVVFNEGWGQYDTARIVADVKRRDPTRLADCASGWNDVAGSGDVHDLHHYPAPSSPEPEPHRAAVLGEFGGLALGVEGHTWNPKIWGYRSTTSGLELTRKYQGLLASAWDLNHKAGLSAAVYTQITDVETEANGLLTYDRAVIKVDPTLVAEVNRGRLDNLLRPKVVVPTSENEPIHWHYTFERPPADWVRPGFNASTWREGPGGFGTKGTPGSVVRTRWESPDIWLVRDFELPDIQGRQLYLFVHHDEAVEIYLNGVLANKTPKYTTGYEELPISDAARATLKPGKNHMAVHCAQTIGGQYIDVGLVELAPPK